MKPTLFSKRALPAEGALAIAGLALTIMGLSLRLPVHTSMGLSLE